MRETAARLAYEAASWLSCSVGLRSVAGAVLVRRGQQKHPNTLYWWVISDTNRTEASTAAWRSEIVAVNINISSAMFLTQLA